LVEQSKKTNNSITIKIKIMKALIYFKEGISLFELMDNSHFSQNRCMFVQCDGTVEEESRGHDGIIKRTSQTSFDYIPVSSGNNYTIYTTDWYHGYKLNVITYAGFTGSIFEHILFSNPIFKDFKKNIDKEKTKNQTVFSSRLGKSMPITEYLENHLQFQEDKYEDDGYDYFCPQSPLLDLIQ
jgi:hypothetical protein